MKNVIPGLIVALAVLSGCDSVTVDKPFGDPPKTIRQEEWAGYWHIDDDTVLRIRVVDAAAGLLEAASIEDGDSDPKIERTKIHLREVGEWKFMFLPGKKEGEGYTWCKYDNYEGKMVIVWLPSTAKFKTAVEQGLLRGEVRAETTPEPAGSPFKATKQTNIFVKDLGKKEIELIASEDKGVYFDWQHPLPFMRIRE